MERTIELEIRSLLPGVDTDEDSCVRRLEKALQNQRCMQRAHLESTENGLKLCLHYDPEMISLAEVKRLAEHAGVTIVNRYHHAVIPIEGMDCSDCAMVVEHGLSRMEGVQAARVNYVAKKLWIEFDTHHLSQRTIEQRIGSLGYAVPMEGGRKWLRKNQELLTSLACGVLLLAGWASSHLPGFPLVVSLILYLVVYTAGGWGIVRHALHALRERRFDTDLLMVMAALGAAVLGDFLEGALLIFLFSLGHSLEERALDKARSAITALADLAPKTALVRKGDGEQDIPVEQLLLRDVVIVRPGTRIPVDGVILSGSSGVDQSPVTGESIPVDKAPGDQVFAGTINGQSVLEVQVNRLAADSTLSRVVEMVEEAQAQKSPTQQLMELFERLFVPAVLAGSLLVIGVPPLFGMSLSASFLRAMTLLVAASPCALALGAPASILAGAAQAARNGVLVKGGAHLENLGRIKAIAFDKTGTMTFGKPEVTTVVAFQPDSFSERQVLGLAAALEVLSGHPLGQAVARSAQARQVPLAQVSSVESLTGRGMKAIFEDKPVLVGSQKLISEAGLDLSPTARERVSQLESNGKTVVLVSLGDEVTGLIALEDVLRPEFIKALAALRSLGIKKTAMLTGDNPLVAASIARQAGLTEFYAGLMPADKAAAILDLVDKYGVVAMVGDGVNDAPALANATLGIAMGGAATDVALETADVALMGDNLSRLPFAVSLGRATRSVIRQNLVIALGVIGLLVVASLTGWIGIGTAIFIHEGSTILVVLNALRLLTFRG